MEPGSTLGTLHFDFAQEAQRDTVLRQLLASAIDAWVPPRRPEDRYPLVVRASPRDERSVDALVQRLARNAVLHH